MFVRKTLLIVVIASVLSPPVGAQSNGFLRFAGIVSSAQHEGNTDVLQVSVYKAQVNVILDEHTTVTGSLGGRVSSRSLTPGLFVEVSGWMAGNGTMRALEVEIKVQSGAVRMDGRVERILSRDGGTSILVNGAEFHMDERTAVVATKNGLAVNGTIEDVKVDNQVDVTGSYVNESGVGPATSGLFHADRVISLRTFRIQGPIRSRTPAEGQPTVIVVQGIVVTLTPETSIVGNGMNERNEAFMRTDNPKPSVIAIEDDAGNPCTLPNACPDSPPKDPSLAGDLQLGVFVRVEGVLEDTGFSPRYTARAVQVEKPNQVRFQGIVASRSSNLLVVSLHDGMQVQVTLDALTQFQGDVTPERLVEVSARFNDDVSMVGRRIKQVE